MRTYLERIDAEHGMARFYAVTIVPTLFGYWAVVREWGRIGQGGTVREECFVSETEASLGAAIVVRGKMRRGYRQRT